jgi:hypothetical protein
VAYKSIKAVGRRLLPNYESLFKQELLKLYVSWKKLIKKRISTMPGTQERKRLDEIYFQVLPIMARIAEVPTNIDVHLAKEILEQDLPESASGMPPGETMKPQDG